MALKYFIEKGGDVQSFALYFLLKITAKIIKKFFLKYWYIFLDKTV